MPTSPATLPPPSTSYRRLMKKVENLVAAVARSDDASAIIHTAMCHIVHNFRDELGISGGRVYERDDDAYVLRDTFGDAKPVAPGLEILRTYRPVERALTDGVLFMRSGDEGADADFEEALGVDAFAAVVVGEERFLLGLDVAADSDTEDVLLSLGIVRHAVDQTLDRERMEDIFRQVRAIQASILPRRNPVFPPYDVAGRCASMERGVGGDLFDYIPITNRILGMVIADATGHGLPAALQVRDIYTGLRMGLGRDFKIVRTVERLNHIIHEGTLTSRFVSMFYGELEANGNFIYVNAGHPPPVYLSADGSVFLLNEGGPVLGPLPKATYERGFVRLRPGDMVVAYTDGVVEATPPGASGRDDEFGARRVLEVMRENSGRRASEIVAAIFSRLEEWTQGEPAGDDRTVLVVMYPGPSSTSAPDESTLE